MTNEKDPHNRGGLIAFVFSMVFSLVFFIYVAWVYPGVDLGEVPKEVPGMAPLAQFDASKVAKPWISSPEMIEYGKSAYQSNCAVCHGPNGGGDGPTSKGLNPPPRNFIEGKWKKGGGRTGLFSVVSNGLEGSSMAAFKHLPATDRWALVHYIQSITKNKIEEPDDKVEKFAASAK